MIFLPLMAQPQFDAAMRKYVSSSELKNIQKFLDNLGDVSYNNFSLSTILNILCYQLFWFGWDQSQGISGYRTLGHETTRQPLFNRINSI